MTNEIEDVFATFHDGTIVKWKGNLEELTLKIECEYLAQEFRSDFENFYVILKNIKYIELEPWMNPITLEGKNKTELKDIFKAELEIAYAKTKDDIVTISCYQYDTGFDYSGGNLFLKAESIELMNHVKEELPPTDLYKANDNYWKNIRTK